MNDEWMESIRGIALDTLKSIREKPSSQEEAGKTTIEKIADAVSEKLRETFSPEALKIAMCYQEKTYVRLSFQKLVEQIKLSYRLKPGMRVCILKTACEVVAFDPKSRVTRPL